MVKRWMALAALTALAAAGCSEAEPTEEDRINGLAAAVAAAADTQIELREGLDRMVRACMEPLGFDVHPVTLETDETYTIQLIGSLPPDAGLIPTATQAAETGMNGLVAPGAPPSQSTNDTTEEFEAQSEDYRAAYYAGLYGIEWEGDTGGRVGDGCHREVNETAFAEATGFDPSGLGTEHWQPPLPEAFDAATRYSLYETDELVTARAAWAECMIGLGRPGFDLGDREVANDFAAYVDLLYHEPEQVEDRYDIDLEHWEFAPPEAAPWTGDEAFEQEKLFAGDVARCGEETELTTAMAESWNAAVRQIAIEYEDEIYAWQDDLESALGLVQEALEGK